MKSHRSNIDSSLLRTLPIFALTVLLMGCGTLPKLEGTYEGRVESWRAQTTFFSRSVGDVLGTYWYMSGYRTEYGQLRKCAWEDQTKLKCLWSDSSGEGAFSAVFAIDLSSFSGIWGGNGMHEPSPSLTWTGRKQ